MLIRSFVDANWNPSIISELHAHGCEGLEIISSALINPVAISDAFDDLTVRIKRVFSGAEYWIISGHEIPQPKTRIVSYRKFWKSAGMKLETSSNDLAEWCVSTVEGPRYFGVAKLSLFQKKDLFYLLSNFKTSWIVVLNDTYVAQDLASHIHLGWDGSYGGCPNILLNFACKNDAILIRNFEADDGREKGVLAIARMITSRALFLTEIKH